jgi:hypothetical protein
MKKMLTLVVLLNFYSFISFAQEKTKSNSVVISPFSLFLGRANVKYEYLRESNFTFGSRSEISFIDAGMDKHMWIIPYGRFYFFNKEQNGLYSELGLGYRLRYAKSADWAASDDWFQSAPVARIYLGAQWFAGKSHTPFDIGIGFNLDAQHIRNINNKSADEQLGTGLLAIFGPMRMFNFRIQTGLSF